MHHVKALVDVREFVIVRDIFIDFEFSLQVIYGEGVWNSTKSHEDGTTVILTFHDPRQLSSPLHTSKSSPTPDAPSDQLEASFTCQLTTRQPAVRRNSRSRGNLFPSSCNTDDSRDAPSFVARLEGSTHDVDLLRRGVYRQECFSLS